MSYSARVIRKLQGREEIFSQFSSDEDDDQQGDVKAFSNKFAMLNDSENEVQSSNEEEKENSSIEKSEEDNQVLPISNISMKDNKRKKKIRKKKTLQIRNNQKDEFLDFETLGHFSGSSYHIKDDRPKKSVLTVEHRYLNPDNELRKIFGSQVLRGSSYRRRSQGLSYKGVWLSRPQDNWPKLGKAGIDMELIEKSETSSYQTYKFVHSKEYRQVQFNFLDAVDSSDHRNIAVALEAHPYHVDSLLTFSDIYKLQEDLKMARELVERCLFFLERSFHSCFNMTNGTSQLPYKYQENRCLFLALFKHMNFVSQRGCNRTALELCKVLLGLDPDDPLCSVLILDYFAIRAGEYQILLDLFQDLGNKRNLSQLPNWMYSVSLAKYRLSQDDEFSIEEADSALQDALIMFPTILHSLLGKCSVQPDSAVATHPYFLKEGQDSTPAGLLILCQLFVERNFMLWKDANVLSWMEKNVKVVIETLKDRDNYVSECSNKRKLRYKKPPMNVYRHSLISELSGISSLLPMEIRTGDLLSHDPLPPSDSITSYQRSERSSRRSARNPLSLFFQSLLPDFNPDDLDVPQDDDNAAVAEDENNIGQLRGNIQALMDAMRELLVNFQEPLHESDQEEFAQDWD